MDCAIQNLNRPLFASSSGSQTHAEFEESVIRKADPSESDSGASYTSTQSTGQKWQTKKVKQAEAGLHLINWTSIEEIMVNNKYPINALQFKNFVESTYGRSNIKEIAEQLPIDTQQLLTMISELYNHVEGSIIKNRLTRIRKKLEEKPIET